MSNKNFLVYDDILTKSELMNSNALALTKGGVGKLVYNPTTFEIVRSSN